MNYVHKGFIATLLLTASSIGTQANALTATDQLRDKESASIAAVFGEPKTRAEVRADLRLWNRAGLDKLWDREGGPDTFSREYRAAYAEYVRLRNGPEYEAEVQRQSGR